MQYPPLSTGVAKAGENDMQLHTNFFALSYVLKRWTYKSTCTLNILVASAIPDKSQAIPTFKFILLDFFLSQLTIAYSCCKA